MGKRRPRGGNVGRQRHQSRRRVPLPRGHGHGRGDDGRHGLGDRCTVDTCCREDVARRPDTHRRRRCRPYTRTRPYGKPACTVRVEVAAVVPRRTAVRTPDTSTRAWHGRQRARPPPCARRLPKRHGPQPQGAAGCAKGGPLDNVAAPESINTPTAWSVRCGRAHGCAQAVGSAPARHTGKHKGRGTSRPGPWRAQDAPWPVLVASAAAGGAAGRQVSAVATGRPQPQTGGAPNHRRYTAAESLPGQSPPPRSRSTASPEKGQRLHPGHRGSHRVPAVGQRHCSRTPAPYADASDRGEGAIGSRHGRRRGAPEHSTCTANSRRSTAHSPRGAAPTGCVCGRVTRQRNVPSRAAAPIAAP